MNKENKIYMYISNNKLNMEKIVEDFSGYLWTIIFNSGITSTDDIREIISESYLILWKNQERLNYTLEITPYLVGIVKNLIKKYYYKKSRNIEINIDDEENVLFANSDMDLNIERQEIAKKIIKILENIKEEEDREIFLDFYYEERKIKEIAIKYNFSESKIKTKLHRLRKKIRKELLEGGYSIYE